MRLRFGGSDPQGKAVTVEFKITREHVQCWVGGRVVYLDREALAAWLAAPSSTFTKDEVTFEPSQWGVVFAFEERVKRTVIKPADVAELADLVAVHAVPVGAGQPS